MNLFKYLFLAPFSRKNQWVNFKLDLEEIDRKRESAMLLFFSFVGLYFLGLFLDSYGFIIYAENPFYFTIENVIKEYILIAIKLMALYFLLSRLIERYLEITTSLGVIINLMLVSVSLVWSLDFVINQIFCYLILNNYNYYTSLSLLKMFVSAGVTAFVIVNGIFGYFHDESLDSSKKGSLFFFIALAVFGFNFGLDMLKVYFNNISFLLE